MDRLLRMMMQSKAFQKFGVGAAMIFLVMFLLHQYKIVPFKVSMPIVVGLILVVLAYQVFLKGAAKKKSSSFEKGLEKDVSSGKEGGKISTRKAQAEIVDRWKNALGELKKAGMDLYTLPWYMLIGEPQSGKSTTLKNSGLEFPVGTEALSGAGGTRNCDWWFTNEGVILDTAGRFSFQEKNAPDAAQWSTFLKLLKKKRSACPINGVIIVIPCSSLLGDSDEERERKAMTLREKLNQLQREFEVQFPVFILLTKSDQMLGFTEFFSGLPAREQHQILGWSMPGPFIQAFDAAKFNETFDEITARIHKLRLKLVGEDRGLNEIDKLYVFPDEFRAIREPLHDYLKTIFMKTHYLPSLFFRGFYFTSGLQQGKPIAKALSSLLRSAGEGAEELIEDLAKVFSKSKAFFIRDFYKDKLFAEKNMVVHSEKKLGVSRKLGLAAIAASVLLIVFTAGFMVWQGLRIRDDITSMETLAGVGENKGGVKNEFITSIERETGPASADGLENVYELSATALMTARDFRVKSTHFVEKFGLDGKPVQQALRDMYWMYVMQNVIHQQMRLLYARIEGLPQGASLEQGEGRDLFGRYIEWHSLNRKWMKLTSSADRSASFDEIASLDWPDFLTEGDPDDVFKDFNDKTDQDESEEIRITDLESLNLAFARELEEGLADALSKDLDFGDEIVWQRSGDRRIPDPEELQPNPPILLPFSVGALSVAENDPIKREIEFVYESLQPLPPETVDEIVNSARHLDRIFNENLAKLSAVDCGFEDPAGSEPYAVPQRAADEILTAYGDLTNQLNALENKEGSLAAFGKGEKDFRDAFAELKWTAGASGKTEDELDEYIERLVEKLKGEFENAEKETKDRLDEIARWVKLEGQLTDNAKNARSGVQALKSLMEEHKRYIGIISGEQRPTTAESAANTFTAWTTENQERGAAGDWGNDTALLLESGDAGSGPWIDDLSRLVKTVETAVRLSDESIRIESTIQAALALAPGIRITPEMTAGAVLGDRHDTAATRRGFEKDQDSYKIAAKLLENLGGPEEALCEVSERRIRANLADLGGRRDRHRGAYQNYWVKAYAAWNPSQWIEPTWSGFLQGDLIQNKRVLVQRVRDHLSEIEEALGMYYDITTGKELDPDASKLLREIQDNQDDLEGAIGRFVDTLNPLDAGDPLEAYRELEEEEKKSVNRVAEVTFLGEKFTEYPKQIEKLEIMAMTEFEQKLREFLVAWNSSMKGRFPFEPDSGRDPQTRLGKLDQVDAPELKNFFFRQSSGRGRFDGGLESFLDEFGDFYNQVWKSQGERTTEIVEFIDRCQALKDFFFVEGEQTYREFKIDLTFTGSPQYGGAESFTNYPEELTIQFPQAQARSWNPRTRGVAKLFTWTPSDYSDSRLIVEAQLKVRTPRATPWKGSREFEGHFVPMAYMYDQIKRRGIRPANDRRGWSGIRFELDRTHGSPDNFQFDFDFKLDRSLPELPDWSKVEGRIR